MNLVTLLRRHTLKNVLLAEARCPKKSVIFLLVFRNNINYSYNPKSPRFSCHYAVLQQKKRDFKKCLFSRFSFCQRRLGEKQIFEEKKNLKKKQKSRFSWPTLLPKKRQILLVFYTDSCSLTGRPTRQKKKTKSNEKTKTKSIRKTKSKSNGKINAVSCCELLRPPFPRPLALPALPTGAAPAPGETDRGLTTV